MKDMINMDKGEIYLKVRPQDINGKSVGAPSNVGYKLNTDELIKSFVNLLKDGGTKRVDKLQFSAKPGGLLITVKYGQQMIPGDYKEIISGFLSHIGKLPSKPAPKPKPEPEVKPKATAKKPFFKK